ncbi:MAG: class I SAM-dependent methyltransferase [Chloroflexi bacterium]|nr:MAG: class I SAM-dependent methyltransferase [Chloroflexota bacterium]
MLSLEKQNALREQYQQRRPGWQPATEQYAALVRKYLPPNGRLLDLGCGRGGLVEQLEHPLSRMIGLDPDWLSLTEHRLGIPRAVGFSHCLPFAPAVFDVVFASWLLEHLKRPLDTLAEIHRVLKPGGVFIFITPNGRHPIAWLNRGLGRFARLQKQLVQRLYGRATTDTFPTYYRANTIPTLHQLGQKTGLTLIEYYPIPDPTYLAFTPFLFRLMCYLEETLPPSMRLHLVGVYQKPPLSPK